MTEGQSRRNSGFDARAACVTQEVELGVQNISFHAACILSKTKLTQRFVAIKAAIFGREAISTEFRSQNIVNSPNYRALYLGSSRNRVGDFDSLFELATSRWPFKVYRTLRQRTRYTRRWMSGNRRLCAILIQLKPSKRFHLHGVQMNQDVSAVFQLKNPFLTRIYRV